MLGISLLDKRRQERRAGENGGRVLPKDDVGRGIPTDGGRCARSIGSIRGPARAPWLMFAGRDRKLR